MKKHQPRRSSPQRKKPRPMKEELSIDPEEDALLARPREDVDAEMAHCLAKIVSDATELAAMVPLEPHNYARFRDQILQIERAADWCWWVTTVWEERREEGQSS